MGLKKRSEIMRETIFNCRIITPLSLGGAKSSQPELRPPSLKGAMRFWWRAVMGNLGLEELKKQEAIIFGSSDEKIGKCKFNLRMLNFGGNKLMKNTPSISVGKNKSFGISSFNSEQNFNIVISSHGTQEQHKLYEEILLITLILGGLGKRSRRGMGSIKILKYNDIECSKKVELKEILKSLNNVNSAGYEIKNNIIRPINLSGEKRPFIKEIQIGRSYRNHKSLFEKIATLAHHNDCLFTGFVGKIKINSFASPVYVSVLENEDEYRPIITTLNCDFGKDIFELKKNNKQNKMFMDKSAQFKGGIL